MVSIVAKDIDCMGGAGAAAAACPLHIIVARENSLVGLPNAVFVWRCFLMLSVEHSLLTQPAKLAKLLQRVYKLRCSTLICLYSLTSLTLS